LRSGVDQPQVAVADLERVAVERERADVWMVDGLAAGAPGRDGMLCPEPIGLEA
jgi:hypothetical protein